MGTEIFSQQSCQLEMVSQNQKRPIWWGGTIFLNQLRKICMTNHKQHVKLIWCEKNGIVFQAF